MSEKRKKSSILSFFQKKNKPNDLAVIPDEDEDVNPDDPQPISLIQQEQVIGDELVVASTSNELYTLSGHSDTDDNNISYYVEKNLTDNEKSIAIEKLWFPNPDYKFPKSGNRNLKFQYSWLLQFKWLQYSKEQNGAYCRICVFFSHDTVGKGAHQTLGNLVTSKFDNWKKAIGAKGHFQMHANTNYHKTCQYKYDNFLAVKNNKVDSVELQINNALKKEIEKNRKCILPIIKTVLFCGRQGIALRGHRENKPLINQNDTSTELAVTNDNNDGNFRQLLRFRIDSGDKDLEDHLQNSAKHALYVSWKIQNEILMVCNNLILKQLVKDINKSQGFTVLADETTDISNKEQLTICARYVHTEQKKIREDFLQFVEVKEVTGKALATTILQCLKSIGLEVKYLVGQGYDGAAAMSGRFNGVQAHIRNDHPMALYMHCASHCLNLAISYSCNVADIRNSMGIMQSVCTFFGYPKRQNILQESIKNIVPESKSSKLKQFCATRWVERHDAVLIFHKLQPAIINALDEIYKWRDIDSSTTANQLNTSIHQLKFQISLSILVKIFSLSAPLSKFLQSENLDLETALNFACQTQYAVQNIRDNVDNEFHSIFQETRDTCNELNINICVPRITGKQSMRCNVATDCPENYYRISLFIPFIDNFLDQMKNRFLEHQTTLKSFICLLPKPGVKVVTKEIQLEFKEILNLYADILNDCSDSLVSDQMSFGELDLWYQSCDYQGSVRHYTRSVLDKYFQCDSQVYPVISKLLQILITLPVTTATGERSFSTLRRLKSYLRNTTGQQRLNGMATLNIHNDIEVKPDLVLDEMAKHSTRRINLKL